MASCPQCHNELPAKSLMTGWRKIIVYPYCKVALRATYLSSFLLSGFSIALGLMILGVLKNAVFVHWLLLLLSAGAITLSNIVLAPIILRMQVLDSEATILKTVN